MQTLKPRLTTMKGKGPKTLSQTVRITGTTLQNIRKAKLLMNPACELCLKEGRVTPAVEVDHITPLWAGGSESMGNRASLCIPCHRAKSAKEAKQRYGLTS